MARDEHHLYDLCDLLVRYQRTKDRFSQLPQHDDDAIVSLLTTYYAGSARATWEQKDPRRNYRTAERLHREAANTEKIPADAFFRYLEHRIAHAPEKGKHVLRTGIPRPYELRGVERETYLVAFEDRTQQHGTRTSPGLRFAAVPFKQLPVYEEVMAEAPSEWKLPLVYAVDFTEEQWARREAYDVYAAIDAKLEQRLGIKVGRYQERDPLLAPKQDPAPEADEEWLF